MHTVHRARGKILFEVFCALSLAASFADAWDQTGAQALLASASITALFAVYWSFGMFARGHVSSHVDVAAQPAVAVADAPEAEVQTAVQESVFVAEPEFPSEPEPAAAKPRKQRARKAQKAAGVVAPIVEPPEPVAIEEPVSNSLPIEQLFDRQPLVQQARPAFGRRPRGPRPLSAV